MKILLNIIISSVIFIFLAVVIPLRRILAFTILRLFNKFTSIYLKVFSLNRLFLISKGGGNIIKVYFLILRPLNFSKGIDYSLYILREPLFKYYYLIFRIN